MEIQDVMAYLRLVAFDDDIAFKRIVNKPRRRFGRVKLQRLQSLQQFRKFHNLCLLDTRRLFAGRIVGKFNSDGSSTGHHGTGRNILIRCHNVGILRVVALDQHIQVVDGGQIVGLAAP